MPTLSEVRAIHDLPLTVAVHQQEKINTAALGEMFWQIIANNRAGGWRKIKQES